MSINFRGMRSNRSINISSYNISAINANTIKTKNVISDNIHTHSYSTNISNSVVHTNVVIDGTYTVNTSGDPNYIIVFNTINNVDSSGVSFYLDAYTPCASINDRVILMFKISNPQTRINGVPSESFAVNMNLSDDFYFLNRGNKVSSWCLRIPQLSRKVFPFIFMP
jgi:hypothetical protein